MVALQGQIAIMVRFFVFVALIVLSVITAACGNSSIARHEYVYIGRDSGRVVTFDMLEKKVDNGHRVFGFEICKAKSYRVCLYGDITLAVPKGHLEVGDEWRVADADFSVIEAELEKDTEIINYTVRTESYGDEIYLFFNEVNGVWGMRMDGDEVYESVGHCGLGC